MTDLSLLVVNYNSWRLCVEAIRSFRADPPRGPGGEPLRCEAVVVDNCSPRRDPAAEAELERELEGFGTLIRHGENGGYSQGMNLARRHARGDWLLVSNPDVVYQPGCVTALVAAMAADPTIGAAAPAGFWDRGLTARLPPNILPTLADLWRLILANVFPAWVRRYSRRRTRAALPVWEDCADVELEMLSGCCFLMRRSDVERIGFFDDRFPLYYEDTDLSLRIHRDGRRIVQVHGARLVHLYNKSGETDHGLAMERYWTSKERYYRKHYGLRGRWSLWVQRRLAQSAFGQRRAALPPHPRVHDLGSSAARPVLELRRACPRFLVEIALDPCFFLAAGVFGGGARWTPSDALFDCFPPREFWFRIVDLTVPGLTELAVFRYTRLAAALAAQPAHSGGGDG